MDKKALLVVDVQLMPFVWKDYGGKTVYREEITLSNIKMLIDKAHQAGAPVIYILHTEGEGSLRAKGQPLWQVHPLITPQEGDIQIIKYHPDSFQETGLQEQLQRLGAGRLVITGIQTEFCIDTVCRSASVRGFTCELASDAHSTFDSDILSAQQIIDHHNLTLGVFGSVKPAADIEF